MNLASPKLGGKQNAFVLLPSGHGGSRTLILTPYGERAPFYMSCDSFLAGESDPVIGFKPCRSLDNGNSIVQA